MEAPDEPKIRGASLRESSRRLHVCLNGLRGLLAWTITLSVRSRFLKTLGALFVAVIALRVVIPGPDLYAGRSFSRTVSDRNGNLLRIQLAPDDRLRLRTRIEDVPESFVQALLLKEDRYFYFHPGINPVSLIRALHTTYWAGTDIVGASTISMQVARLRSGLETRSIGGKIVQILSALQLELFYSKSEILEAYLNLAPFGGNIEGVQAASLFYFGKRASQLTLPEILTLVVIPEDPNGRTTSAGFSPALEGARARLYDRWTAMHGNNRDASGLLHSNLRDLAFAETSAARSSLPFRAPHETTALLAGPGPEEVTATLDWDLQQVLERQLARYVSARRSLGVENGAALLIDYTTMEVLASVGSADFFDDGIQGQVDGTRARRSPGSTLKPFAYAIAFDRGLLHARSLLSDSPAFYGSFEPENYDRDFAGPIQAGEALVRSRNIPALAVTRLIGVEALHSLLARTNVKELHQPGYYQLGLVLGGAELTMRELVGLYGMLARGGDFSPLRNRISAPDEVEPGQGSVLSPEAAFMTLDILRQNPRPHEGAIGIGPTRLPVYWKTGTSFSFRDAWAVGIFDNYVLAVWIGNFDGRSNTVLSGRETAGPLFFQIVDAIRSRPGHRAFVPEAARPTARVREIEVCSVSGALPQDFCPHRARVWFIPGRSPIERCSIHREVAVDPGTGYRICPGMRRPDAVRIEVHEFWPGDLRAVLAEARMAHQTPPSFSPGCDQNDLDGEGLPPAIRSPLRGVNYTVRGSDRTSIPLSAHTEADVHSLFWFVDGGLIGRADANQTLLWTSPGPGSYQLRVVDDAGRTSSRQVRIERILP
ncbi:MAG: penicillin-binding protein 1C [Spirochaetales bacterium]|nr:penicillin-binding protein 1C [Leptospiraceae bacterium]MCP5481123.1 penicillin-binding protein 1C [Spirochaetales bacterium]